MRNKHLCLVLTLCALLCVSLLALGTAALEADESGVVHLRTADDVLELMNDATLWDKTILVDKDADGKVQTITLPDGSVQSPIGNATTAFTGTFDGQGNTISGIKISGGAGTGFFGKVVGATIKNLTVEGTVTSTGNAAGGLIGWGVVPLTIENCTNKVDVTGTNRAAGLVGSMDLTAAAALTVTGCKNYGTIKGTGSEGHIGGLFGRLYKTVNNQTTVITDCANYGDITATVQMAGGLVGRYESGSKSVAGDTTITRFANYGTISSAAYVGGVFGIFTNNATSKTILGEFYNAGEVKSTSTKYVGGVCGYFRSYTSNVVSLSDCMNVGKIYAKTGAVGGIIGTGNGASGVITYTRLYNAGSVTAGSQSFVKPVAGAIHPSSVMTDSYYSSTDTYTSELNSYEVATQVTLASTVAENKTLFPALAASDVWTMTTTGPELTTFHTHTEPNADGQCDTCGLQLTGCKHANTEPHTITPATCTATGTAQNYCLDCETLLDGIVVLPIDSANHTDYVWRENAESKYEFVCAACNTVVKTQDEQPVVYLDGVSGDDANDGLTATTEVKTLEEAVKRIAAVGGTVHFTARLNVTDDITLPAYAKPITFEGNTDASGNANTGFVYQANKLLTLGGETIFDKIVFKAEGATNMNIAANWNNVTFGYVRIHKDATVGLYAGNYVTTADDTEAKTTVINLNGAVIASDSTAGHVFYKNVALGSWFGTDGQTVSNKTVTLNVNDGTLPNGTAVSATVGTLYTMSSTNDAAKRHTNTPNCTSVVNLNGDTVVTTLRTGDRNVNGSSTVTDATGYLDSLTLNFNDNSTLGATAVLRNVKNATLKISTEAEGRTTAITKGVQLQAFGDFASEGTVGQVNAAYGEHSFAASLANPIAALAGHEANYQINADVTPEHVWGEGEVTTAPGVGTVGEKTYTCTCGATKTEEVAALKAALAQKSITAATDKASGESTLRFIAALEVADGVTVEKIGTYISLVSFNEDGTTSTAGAKVVAKEQTVTDAAPASFAVDLTGIPADQTGTSVFAWAYAELSDSTRVVVAFDAATVAALVSAQ